MRTSLILGAAAVLIMVTGPGCGDDDDNGQALVAKMQQCDLLTTGTVNLPDEVDTAEEQCFIDCILAASCDDLEVLVCDTGTFSPATEACFEVCDQDPTDFVCVDGSGTISEDWVCDGWDDCVDGSDEVGCPTFDCADGLETISLAYVCNDYDDCADGSDEAGCPSFDCADGSDTIPEDYVCDYYDDCADGSDEVGCTGGFDCADGLDTISEEWVCDYWDDCDDGSDEVGCPGFVCLDGSGTVSEDSVCDLNHDCDDGSDEDQGCAQPICPI